MDESKRVCDQRADTGACPHMPGNCPPESLSRVGLPTSNQCPYCGYEDGKHNAVCIAAELQRVYALVSHWAGEEKRLRTRISEALSAFNSVDTNSAITILHRALSGDSSAAAQPHCISCRCFATEIYPSAPETKSSGLDEGKLWSFLRDVMTTGCAIETDTRARGRRYEEHSARLDAAARDAIPQFFQRLGLTQETTARQVFNHERDCGLTNDVGTCECPQNGSVSEGE